eukprot:5367903-Pleurochrysis_carterae.AAC.1
MSRGVLVVFARPFHQLTDRRGCVAAEKRIRGNFFSLSGSGTSSHRSWWHSGRDRQGHPHHQQLEGHHRVCLRLTLTAQPQRRWGRAGPR